MNETFIPFGANYYRANTPKKSEWKKDIENMREYGFNTIKVLALWRWNNPQKNVFYFEDLDELMNLAKAADMKVVINVLFDSAPAWFFRRYPDSVMITCDGRRVEPRVTAWRAIGGAPGPCYNHSEGIKARCKFLKKIVERYKDHQALYLWDLWNEPEPTCGILRKPIQSDMVCYCDTCKETTEVGTTLNCRETAIHFWIWSTGVRFIPMFLPVNLKKE
jgi:beta-galactosidase